MSCRQHVRSNFSFDDIIERADNCLENRPEQQRKEAVAAQVAHVARWTDPRQQWNGLTVAEEGGSCCWRIRLGSLVTQSSQQPCWQPLDPGWEEWRERQRLILGRRVGMECWEVVVRGGSVAGVGDKELDGAGWRMGKAARAEGVEGAGNRFDVLAKLQGTEPHLRFAMKPALRVHGARPAATRAAIVADLFLLR
ncbi:hypothetical protein HaLaN_25777 [Haematococcus lacustris]|uniref:Uncharacterized protein n=1 Tax=Haematococcus lacustris TaxID=44745 RepID=A0A699ZZ54_HAELA|nr:hypothetical protein HaLaN_25777 [Haematococcus lacustris]